MKLLYEGMPAAQNHNTLFGCAKRPRLAPYWRNSQVLCHSLLPKAFLREAQEILGIEDIPYFRMLLIDKRNVHFLTTKKRTKKVAG